MLLKNVILNNKIVDILIKNDVIAEIGKIDKPGIDCSGLTALPAFCDMHTHLREPGQTAKEDILSGTSAGVSGGFSDICCMPNTTPVIDNEFLIEYILLKAEKVAKCNVHPIGAVTVCSKGEMLAELRKMKSAGAIAFSDDGQPVTNPRIMRLALEYAKDIDGLLISHCEDKQLTDSGVANEGKTATELGLKGICNASEEVMVARDVLLAEESNTKVHIAHISTKGSVQLIREAKARGVRVTAETCPHYIAGTDEMIDGYNTMAKVNPPLRSEKDRQAVIAGIQDGTIDVIATDHAPHAKSDKNCLFENAANGISGLETAFGLVYTELVKPELIGLGRLIELMSTRPREIMKLPVNDIKVGNNASITLVNLDEEYEINSRNFFSKGKNTPFDNRRVYGRVHKTIVNGKMKYEDGAIL